MIKQQHTVRIHVEHVLFSHKCAQINDGFGDWAQKTYKCVKEVDIVRRKKHGFLGMSFNFSKNGVCHIIQNEHVRIDKDR